MDKRNRHSDEDQQWMAFRYVSGELSAVEADAFELQMLDDEQLCDAVVEATLLSASIAASKQPTSVKLIPTESPSPSQRARQVDSQRSTLAAVVAVCCCLTLVVAAGKFSDVSQTGEELRLVDSDESSDAERLVDAWAAGLGEDEISVQVNGGAGEHELDVPEWLFAAVSLASPDSSTDAALDGSEEDGEWF